MMKVWMLLLYCVSFSALATEFNHIKLNPAFEHYLTQPQMKSSSLKSAKTNGALLKSNSASQLATADDEPQTEADSIQSKILSSVLGAAVGTQPQDDGEESLLLGEIRRNLEASHVAIGEQETHQLDILNRQFNLGTQNFSGFSWQKPFGVVQVYADRQVVPNLFGDNWLIQDTFTFEVEATTFLEKLNDAGLASMSQLEIGAFAGITFKRVYTYYHYADSYLNGINADFSKLFLPFLKFNQNGVNNMGNDEIMKRDDNWSARVGGLITTPPLYNVSLSAGVLAEYAYQQSVSVQNNAPADLTAEKIRMSVKSKKAATIGATLSLQLDFFKLIQFSLLSYDLSYEYASGKEFTLGMSTPQLAHVQNDANEGPEFRKILAGFGDVKNLEPYVVALNESSSSSLNSKLSVLIWGTLKKSKTEQIRTIKNQIVKVFYKNYSQSVKVVQNFLSRIFSAIVYKILKLPVGTKNAAIYDRTITLEYEATHPQASDPGVIRLDSSEQFSFVLTQSYEASRTDRWVDLKFKNDVIWFIDSFTALPKDYKAIVRSEQLRGPMKVESHIRIEKAGFDHLIKKSEDDVFFQIASVCGSERAEEWAKKEKRVGFLNRLQVGNEICVKQIGKRFLGFKADYLQNALKPSIAKFKDFLTSYYKESESQEALMAIFGAENTFVNGSIQATTSSGSAFFTSFSSGQFRGLGVIDNFKRNTGSRMPASIISE